MNAPDPKNEIPAPDEPIEDLDATDDDKVSGGRRADPDEGGE